MASICARRLLQRSPSSSKTLLSCGFRTSQPSVASGPSKLSGLSPNLPSSASHHHRLFSKCRLPLELGCVESLMPLHSVTASALLKSMLSSEVGHWGCLSEGFATPL